MYGSCVEMCFVLSYKSQAMSSSPLTLLFTFDYWKKEKLVFNFLLISRFSFAHFWPTNLLCLFLSGGSAKKVKVNLEPFVDAGVNGMVLVADLLRCQTLLSGLVLCSCAVLISATHKKQVPASQTTVSWRKWWTNKVSRMSQDEQIWWMKNRYQKEK